MLLCVIWSLSEVFVRSLRTSDLSKHMAGFIFNLTPILQHVNVLRILVPNDLNHGANRSKRTTSSPQRRRRSRYLPQFGALPQGDGANYLPLAPAAPPLGSLHKPKKSRLPGSRHGLNPVLPGAALAPFFIAVATLLFHLVVWHLCGMGKGFVPNCSSGYNSCKENVLMQP